MADFKCILCGADKIRVISDYRCHTACFSGLKVVECLGCGHRAVSPKISDEALTEYYQKDYYDPGFETRKHDLLLRRAKSRLDFIMHHAVFPSGNRLRVLDFGAGFGHIGKELQLHLKRKRILYDVVESNRTALDYLAKHRKDTRCIARELSDLKCDRYDLIILSHVLEHYKDPVGLLGKISERMSPEGILFVETPNEYDLWKQEQEPHLQFFSERTLGKLLLSAGFCLHQLETSGDLIGDILDHKESKNKNLDKIISKTLKAQRLERSSGCGGHRRWIRAICAKPKKILFVMQYPVYVRNFEPLILELANRGHSVHLLFNDLRKYRKEGVKDVLDARLAEIALQYPRVTYDILTVAPEREHSSELARDVRAYCDYLRFLDPKYTFMHSMRKRSREKFFSGWIVFADKFHKLVPNRTLLFCVYRAMESFLGVPAKILSYLKDGKFDALLVTPLVNIGSEQVDYIKAAKKLGLPCVLAVHSWDNLTNKGLMRILPDRVCVWNRFQADEAVAMHGMQKKNILVSGAQCYDHWFERKPDVSLENFCKSAGLHAQGGFLLYLGSSRSIAPLEVPFVRRWVKAVRASSDRRLAGMPILVRPHPQNARQWDGVQFEEPDTAVYPRAGNQTIGEDAKRQYFHSLYYAKAVVGINTSAMIEASILRKPVLTILEEAFKGSQAETYHFRYLKETGPVYSSSTLDEHVVQLSRLLEDSAQACDRDDKFIAEFIRPHGMGKRATDILADQIVAFLQAWPAGSRHG